MDIDIAGFLELLAKCFAWAFQLPGPDGFKLGIGWYVIIIGVVVVVIKLIKKIGR